MSIIPSPGVPPIGPNVVSEILIDHDFVVATGQVYYTTSLRVLFANFGLQTDYFDLNNAGALWNVNTGDAYLVHAFNFGTITNSGLAVAQTSGQVASARTFRIESTWENAGLNNSGRIFALAANGYATALADWSQGAVISNSNLIAAQGLQATAIGRSNGGRIANLATGRILAEGADAAIAIFVGAGHHDATPGDFVDIDNAGLIQAASTSAATASIAILVSHLGDIFTLENSGTIAGDFAIYADDFGFSPPGGGVEIIRNTATGIINGDMFLGGQGDNVINGGVINGFIRLHTGNDTFDNTVGRLNGGADLGWGDDTFIGGGNADAALGDRGADNMRGDAANDLLLGGRGEDRLVGGAGNDGLYGEWGDDVIFTQDADRVAGAAGDDAIVLGDLRFADVDGGTGRDILILPDATMILDLQSVLGSGRIHGFEEVRLPSAQRLVVRPSDVAAMAGGSQLFVTTTSAGGVDLVGAWIAGGISTVNGVQYRSYTSSGATVFVAGAGVVVVASDPPSSAVGLDPIAGGADAPLPGSVLGVDLTGSVTQVGSTPLAAPEVIDADEQWLSLGGSEINGDGGLTNFGKILANASSSQNRGYLALNMNSGVDMPGVLANFGEVGIAVSGGTDAELAANINHLNTYGIERAGGVGNAIAVVGGAFRNVGVVSARADVGAAFADYNIGMSATNQGTLSAVSDRFVAFGVYASNGGTLANSGVVMAEGDVAAIGVFASTHRLTLDNQGTILAIAHAPGALAAAIRLYNQLGEQTLLNSGTIEANVALQTLQMVNGGGVFLDNSGQIRGRIELNLQFDNTPGSFGRQDILYNHGAIAGDIRLGAERDVYFGAGGAYQGVLRGEDGADILIGGLLAETLDGGAGDDVLQGGGGADALSGGNGADVFIYVAAADSQASAFDTITDFVSGVDRIDLSALTPDSVALNEAGGTTTVSVSAASGLLTLQVSGVVLMSDLTIETLTTIPGTTGADTLVASVDGSVLAGGEGDDTLVGGPGADSLDGGAGENLMFGALGDDIFHVDSGGDTVRELPGQGIDTLFADLGAFFGYSLPSAVENLVLVSGDYGNGNELDNVITGNGLGNRLDGGAGADTLIGGANDDLYVIDSALDVVVELANEGHDVVLLSGSGYVLNAWVEDLNMVEGAGALTASGNDLENVINGNESTNSIDGGAGADLIRGWLGADELHGGDGADEIHGQPGADAIYGDDGGDVLFGESGADIVRGGAGDDRISGVSPMIFDLISQVWRPSEGEDFASDTLFGEGGDDTLEGGGGGDVIDGGAGIDTAIFVDSSEGVNVYLNAQAGVGGDADGDTFVGVENLAGSNFADTLLGDSAANVLYGGAAADQLFGLAGADTLDGGAGVDQMFGGEGDDLYIVDNVADFAFEAQAAWGSDLVQASVSYTLGQNIDHLTLLGSALVGQGNGLANVIIGNASANTLFGFAGNDTLNGGGGVDQMFGGLGDDTYVVDNAADQTFEAQSAWGTDTAQASVTYQLGTNIDNLVLVAGAGGLTGRGNILDNTITGNESANTLFGFAGNDTLNGGAGADQLYGREGNDTYIVDNVGDVVAEANAAWGTDTILASVTYFLAPNLENLTLTGGGAINGNGNGLANIMVGNSAANNLFGLAGNDTLDGGGGADSLFGGEGDDLYIVDNAGDVGFEASAAWGTDLVQASVSHTLGTNLDNLALTGAAAINGTGNGLANVINGNDGANTLNGLGGADTLNGGAGADALDGGAGDDAFVFAPGSGSDTVSGFIAGGVEDSISLSAYNGSGITWTISQIGADTLFAFSNGDQITLLGVSAVSLVQTDPFGYG